MITLIKAPICLFSYIIQTTVSEYYTCHTESPHKMFWNCVYFSIFGTWGGQIGKTTVWVNLSNILCVYLYICHLILQLVNYKATKYIIKGLRLSYKKRFSIAGPCTHICMECKCGKYYDHKKELILSHIFVRISFTAWKGV